MRATLTARPRQCCLVALAAGETPEDWHADASGCYTKVEFPSERPTRRREAIALTEAYVRDTRMSFLYGPPFDICKPVCVA